MASVASPRCDPGAHGGISSLKLSDDHWGLFEHEKPRNFIGNICIPRASRAQRTFVFLINLQNKAEIPSKTRVILGSKYTKVVEMEGISLRNLIKL